MGLFGPKYPQPLQQVVSHAERFCDVIDRLEANTSRHEAARSWLTGRREEVEVVLELLVGEWARGRRSTQDAAGSMKGYLFELHAGACALLGLRGHLACCEDDLFLTIRSDLERGRGPAGSPLASSPESTADTWPDRGGLLREMEATEPNAADAATQRKR
jgi:hypothetical protein